MRCLLTGGLEKLWHTSENIEVHSHIKNCVKERLEKSQISPLADFEFLDKQEVKIKAVL